MLRNDVHDGSATVLSFPSVSPARIAVTGRQKLNSTAAEFETALNRGGWDLVIVSVADAETVSKRLADKRPVLLPVVLNPSDTQMKRAKLEYEVVLRGPVKRASFVSAVDEALAHRSKKSAG